jgi:hypothetical protein
MTYLELAEHILNEMTKEQQGCDVTIYNHFDDEFFAATIKFADVGNDADGILDQRHPYLTPKDE